MQILTDADVERLADMATFVPVCRRALELASAGELTAPPRQRVAVGNGDLVFTVGGDPDGYGFRVYDTMPGSRQDQIVAVWSRERATLEGVVIGDRLGAYRTGAIGGVAVDLLARADATRCAVIGSGRQARTQLLATAAVRDLESVRVFSRSPARRSNFARDLSAQLGVPVTAVDSVGAATDAADIVLLATTATSPVIGADVLRPGVHVTTVGPKGRHAHELPVAVAEAADVLATDTPQQLRAAGDDHLLAGSAARSRITDLAALAARGRGRDDEGQRTVYLSAGLAGTEVLVARELLRRAQTA